MELTTNQFLKISTSGSYTVFEIIEFQPPKRPKRWQIEVPQNRIVNRHTQNSKIRLLKQTLHFLKQGIDNYA